MTATIDRVIDLTAPRIRTGTHSFEATDAVTDWHVLAAHQLEYAMRGTIEVHTRDERYLLPPQQALWIPAGVVHRTSLRHVQAVSVLFDVASGPPSIGGVQVLPASPLLREMITYATRWPITRSADDPLADVFFQALAALVQDWLGRETPLSLPTSTNPVIATAMAFTDSHLRGVLIKDVARAVDTSERTLRRLFLAETGMTWRDYLRRSRLLRAMTLLAEPGPTVLTVSARVGFDSVSAFTRAFVAECGETPSAYRRRVLRA